MAKEPRNPKAAKAPRSQGDSRKAKPSREGPPPSDAADLPVEGRDSALSERDLPVVPFPVVAVGASAGGLEAFTALLTELPADTGMAFVLIQHLDPSHESALTALLQRATSMPVDEVTDRMPVEPNHIYVIPPNTLMTISKGALMLTSRPRALRSLPIDHFFQSLADQVKSRAIGVILSGTASDGTQGLKAIKAQGGITFAQDTESAQYPGMPRSAAAAGYVDFTMSPAEIAAELTRIRQHPYFRDVPEAEAPPADHQEDGITKICALLRSTIGVDFRLYKRATVSRRIGRRLALHRLDSLDEYLRLLRKDRAEQDALYEDILIHVTGFFRDPESFQALQQTVLAKMVSAEQPKIRVWVPGCSSGEEAYSIAMLVAEQLAENRKQATVQIFGTDISDRAIKQARAGIYQETSIADLSPERRRRFFRSTEGGFQIAKSLRDMCVFARHDLAKDPPFSRLDLISCRNVLIYVGPVLQKRVIETFHYALKPGGRLLLGRAESLSAYGNLFTVEDSKHRIFLRSPSAGSLHLQTFAEPADTAVAQGAGPVVPAFDLRREVGRILLDQYSPPALVVDPRLQVIHFHGNTGPFLEPAAGEPSFHLLRIARPELVGALRSAIQQAKEEGAPVRLEGVRLNRNSTLVYLDIEVSPLVGRHGKGADFLIVFRETAGERSNAPEPAKGEEAKAELERKDRELESLQQQLRALVQDHEAASEEMRAMNEEVLSANEELQSTNEELETAREELESTNEELHTLNEELQQRNADLTETSEDLTNLLTGVAIPIIFLDSQLLIRRFTPLAGKLLNLIATDAGRPLSDIASTLIPSDWSVLATEVIRHRRTLEREVRDREGRWYNLRMRPYETGDQQVGGVLVALLDIDAVKRSLDESRQARDFAEAIIDTLREPLLVLDSDFRVVKATSSFYATFETSEQDTLGQVLFEVDGGQWDIPRLRTALKQILPRERRFESVEVEREFPALGHRSLLFNARWFHRPDGGSPTILLAIEDITGRRKADRARLAKARGEERRRIARELHDDLVQRLAGLAVEIGNRAAKPPVVSTPVQEELRSIQAHVVRAAEVARRVAYTLYPPELDDLGLEAALRSYCDEFSRQHGIAVEFHGKDVPPLLATELASCLYRVTQESLLNVTKYARATRSAVSVEGRKGWIRLRVEDPGVGLAEGALQRTKGLGILSMRERVAQLDGRFSITSKPGKGTQVTVELPVQVE